MARSSVAAGRASAIKSSHFAEILELTPPALRCHCDGVGLPRDEGEGVGNGSGGRRSVRTMV